MTRAEASQLGRLVSISPSYDSLALKKMNSNSIIARGGPSMLAMFIGIVLTTASWGALEMPEGESFWAPLGLGIGFLIVSWSPGLMANRNIRFLESKVKELELKLKEV